MQAITIKMDDEMLNNIDKCLKKHNFSTRTEFIRHFIRKGLDEMSKEELMTEFFSRQGKYKHNKTTDAEMRKIKEQVGKEILREYKLN